MTTWVGRERVLSHLDGIRPKDETMPDTRTETDSFGPIEVPGDSYWGAQTERSIAPAVSTSDHW